MDIVLAPFLDTYHRNIQNSYQQMTQKIAKKIKDEISQALVKKKKIYESLVNLADKLKIPGLYDQICAGFSFRIAYLMFFSSFLAVLCPLLKKKVRSRLSRCDTVSITCSSPWLVNIVKFDQSVSLIGSWDQVASWQPTIGSDSKVTNLSQSQPSCLYLPSLSTQPCATKNVATSKPSPAGTWPWYTPVQKMPERPLPRWASMPRKWSCWPGIICRPRWMTPPKCCRTIGRDKMVISKFWVESCWFIGGFAWIGMFVLITTERSSTEFSFSLT